MSLALACAAGAVAQDGDTIRWVWEPGRMLRYRMVNEMEQQQEIPGMGEFEVLTRQEFVMRQEVGGLNEEGLAEVTVTYEQARMKMSMPFGEFEYDSTVGGDEELLEGNPMLKPIAAMVGKSITFTVDPTGSIGELRGMTTIMDHAFRDIGAEMPEGMLKAFKEGLGDEAMRQMFEQGMKVLPDGPAEKGASWSQDVEQKIPMLGTLRGENTFTLYEFVTEWGHPCARIKMESTKLEHEPAEENPFAGMGAEMELGVEEMKMTGETLFAIDVGYLLRSETKMEMKTVIKVDAGQAERMEIKQDTKQKVVMELIDRK